MINARPVNLGSPRTMIGRGNLRLPAELTAARSTLPVADATPLPPSIAAALGHSEGAAQTPTIESGSIAEALAAALEGGLHGRAAYRGQQREESVFADALARENEDRAGTRELQQAQIARLLAQTENEDQPDVRVTQSGTFWSPEIDPQTGAPRILGRDPNWQPPAGMIYQPPAGYRGTQDALEPIPGGPVDARSNESGRARRDRLASSASQLQNALDVLTSAEGQVNGWTAGAAGQALRGFGSTGAHDLQQELEPVIAILAFENLAEMRRNSETGGALGSIAVRELDLLGRTVRSLETSQSPDQLRRHIQEVRAQLSRTLQAVQAAQNEFGVEDESQTPAPTTDGAAPAQGRVRVWNPATGRLE